MQKETSKQEIAWRRMVNNGLHDPFAHPLECVTALAGIQSQFQQWAEISIMNRCLPGLTMGELAGFYLSHDIINLWGQRNTLHMYVQEDWNKVSDVYLPVLSEKNHTHKRYPDDFTHLMAQVGKQCSAHGHIPKAKVLDMISERMQGRTSASDSFEYVFINFCCLKGIFFGLPEKPGIKTFIGHKRIDAKPWQENKKRAGAALESLMLRYFQYYGPATLADFSHWSGLAQSISRKCLDSLKDRLEIYVHEGRDYFAYGDQGGKEAESEVLLLGKFDPLFVSYKHKDWIIPDELQKQVWRSAGWVEAVVLEGDKAIGTWRHTLKGRKMSMEISPFGKIKTASRKKVQHMAERLAVFWDKSLDLVTFE